MKQFKALLVGAGGMGRTWGKNLQGCEKVDLVAWVDIRKEAAEKAAEDHELSGIYTGDDLGKAISEVKPDFVVDVTIPESHRDITLQALAAGIPVIGEKPMAHSMAAAREMVAASEKANKLYMVSQSRRYDSRLYAYNDLIKQIGELGILNSDFYLGPHFGGFRDEMSSPLLLDMAIHTFDAARYLCQADPVAVYCEEFNPRWSWYKGDVSSNALFEMTGGLRYTYRGSWCAEGKQTSWEGEWRAIGSKGTALWNGHSDISGEVVAETTEFFSKTEPILGTPEKGIHGGIAGSLRDFLNALETGATPMGECHDNIKSLGMVFAAIESAAVKQRIVVEV